MSTKIQRSRTAPSEHDVLERLLALMHLFKRHTHEAAREDAPGLTPMEVRVLRHFSRRPGGTQKDLVQHSGRDKAQIARLVKLLEQRGLMTGAASPDDQRSVVWELTEPGRAITRLMDQHRHRFEAQLLQGFSAVDRRQAVAYLDRMLQSFKTDPP